MQSMERKTGNRSKAENSGTALFAGDDGVEVGLGDGDEVGLGLGFETGKVGVEKTSGTSRFDQLGSCIWTVEMSRMVTNG